MRDGVLSVEARIGFVSGLSIPVAGADGTVWDSVPAAQDAIEQATW
jgi:hypothetical protein